MPWNLFCCEVLFVQSEELALEGFLMSEYLTLSRPRAAPLLSPESASVNSSSVIGSSFQLASVRVLSSAFQTAFLSTRLFRLLCWAKLRSSAEDFSLLVFSTAPLAPMRLGVLVFAPIKLPEVSECYVSVQGVKETFPLFVL